MFDNNNDYHLWMTSFSTDLQDLIKCNQLIHRTVSSQKEKANAFFFFKIAIGFLHEALDILDECLKTDSAEKLYRIKEFKNKYDELQDLLNNDPQYRFITKIIVRSRNKVFHYNNFYKYKGDKKETYKVLQGLYNENHYSYLTVSTEEKLLNDYSFSEELQLNQFDGIFKSDCKGNNFNDIISKLAVVMGLVINLFESIVLNHIMEIPEHKKLPIRYR